MPALFSRAGSLQSSGERRDQVGFLFFEHRAEVEHNMVVFDARDDRSDRTTAKTLFEFGGGMAFAADVKDWSAKTLRWSGASAGKRFALDEFDFYSCGRQIRAKFFQEAVSTRGKFRCGSAKHSE